ncbi:hypothetical protein HYV73_00935 [Candidatus Uhrbacteria bacterium]|nr:hypothetical protein [Candidatus Uhrbacteria bacterium]
MSVINEHIAQTLESKFLKFGPDGKIGPIRIITVERIFADDPKFGDKEGMKFELTFEGGRILNTVSRRLMRCLRDVNSGDLIEITRTGSGMNTDFFVRIIERAETQKADAA